MKKKILIVDDNEDLNRFVQMSFKDSYETLSAKNGEEAVGLAVMEVPDLIIMDLIILDLLMNGMNGFEAIRLIRQVPKTRSIPIIAITAGLSNTVEDECIRIGCNEFLFKPFTASQLISSITMLLNQNGSNRATKEPRQHQMKKKILIVDDNPDLICILQVQLKYRGYDTVQATNGMQAVDIATAQLPDLIVMDIMMPQMNGLQAARLIRENPKTRSIPILASTAKLSHADKKECLESGFKDHIAKPFTSTQLAFRIEKLLKQYSGNLSTLPS